MELDAEAERQRATDAIATSSHRLRVIVAGPGTGKTHAFAAALDAVGGGGLALTFIRMLATDLSAGLAGKAAAYTFHAYCKLLIFQLSPAGLTANFVLYPPFAEITAIDLNLLGAVPPPTSSSESALEDAVKRVEQALADVDDSMGLPDRVMDLGSYYDAASFTDIVFRVFRHLERNPEETPAYPLVVVDEYQDFTRLEVALILQLGFKSRLLIAGDDDQALYGFRFASAAYIRELAGRKDVEPHNLPYCSRCTEVVVAAVNSVIQTAVGLGNLDGRLTKTFGCYLPDKGTDSEAYPKLIDARCSHRSYPARYIESEIAKISPEDIEASRKKGHPTVLIISPRQFVRPVFERLQQGRYPQAVWRKSDRIHVRLSDGYRLLTRDPRLNLGWRILVFADPFDGWEDAVRAALESGGPLVDQLPDEYRDRHIGVVDRLRDAMSGTAVNAEALASLAADVDESEERLVQIAGLPVEEIEEDAEVVDEEGGAPADEGPTILCTSMTGAKGLSAEHVFVVGMVNGHFPRDAGRPTDEEICQFLVALSRTRKQCHLVSVNRLGGEWVNPSVFLSWVSNQSVQMTVNKTYWEEAEPMWSNSISRK